MRNNHDALYDVVQLRDGALELRLNGVVVALSQDQAVALFRQGLLLCGFAQDKQLGLKVADADPRVMNSRLDLADAKERLRANGKGAALQDQERDVLFGPWYHPDAPPVLKPATPAPQIRRFVKATPLKAPPVKTFPARTRKTSDTRAVDATIDVVMFEDPRAQLVYEVKHAYLLGVPEAQRPQWPMPEEYVLMDSFMADIDTVAGQVSRQQVVAAIIDVVTGRVNSVNSRKPRPLREGGGIDSRPVVLRSTDQAMAWRANVSSSTPAARRIMWWRRPDGGLELARLATHDDMDMPER